MGGGTFGALCGYKRFLYIGAQLVLAKDILKTSKSSSEMKTNTIKEYLWIHAINVHGVSNSIAKRPCKKSLCQEDVLFFFRDSVFLTLNID